MLDTDVEATIGDYFRTLARLIDGAEVTDGEARPIAMPAAFARLTETARRVHDAGNTIFFVGNGGSAGIAAHLAIDYTKNGGIRSQALNDASALTCLANDYGYEQVFARQLGYHARPGDLLVAISSSGQSKNILAAVRQARALKCGVVTYSGFDPGNDLRRMGDMNFYIGTNVYGLIEVAHLSLCHAVLDIDAGWTSAGQAKT